MHCGAGLSSGVAVDLKVVKTNKRVVSFAGYEPESGGSLFE